jgi:ABC-type transport system substrate-binding protein
MMGNAGDANIASIDNLLTIQRTNPEIDVWPVYGMGTAQFVFNLALQPTSDLNVRKALNMAVDRETVSATFEGWGDPEPIGLMLPVEGWSWPYDEWPEDVKQEYTYNPERAEELLDAAGYKRGADGYRFKIMLGHYDRWDTSYSELVGGYLDAIGVDSELDVQTYPEHAAEQSLVTSRFAAITTNHGYASGTLLPLRRQIQKVEGWSYTKVNDPRLLALYEGGKDSLDIEEIKSISRQTDEIFVREHFGLAKTRTPQFSVSQPWVIGYSGEWNMGKNQRNTLFARLWIDSELKAAMGH